MAKGKVHRRVRLDISRVASDGYFRTTSTISVVDLRVAFSIEKRHGAKRANTGKIQVWNFSRETRAELQHSPLQIRLAAGYEDDLRDLFVGDVRYVTHRHEAGVDVVTEIELGDGERAYTSAKHSKSYRGGINARAIVGDLIGAMGLRVPKSVDDAEELLGQLSGGYVANGLASKQLTQILGKHGYGWSIQNGQMQVLKQDTGILPHEALLIDQEHGMVDVPYFGAPTHKKGKSPTLNVKTLLEPIAVPGLKLRVESEEVRGFFKAIRVAQNGDTEGDAWHTEYEAVPL